MTAALRRLFFRDNFHWVPGSSPSAMAKTAADPAAIAAQALHRLCLYTMVSTALGSSRLLSNPRLILFGFFNLMLADINQSTAAAAAQPSDINSHKSFNPVPS
jgi:hypothetical protein